MPPISDQSAALDLLRRAICQRDEHAWEALMSQYRSVVLAALRRHGAWLIAAEGEDYWVNRSFERFWSAVTPDRLDMFPSIGPLLRYLQMCTHSVIIDELRIRRRSRCEQLSETTTGLPTHNGAEDTMVAQLSAGELWGAIASELHDEPERLVASLTLLRGMKPAQVRSLHPEHFRDAADVYRVKRNVLERLRRNSTVRAFREC